MPAIVLVALLTFGAFAPLRAQAQDPSACATFVDVPAQGPSCRTNGGWLVKLGDGTTVFTHGADPAPTTPDPSAPASSAPSDPACVDISTSGSAVLLIYAAPSDKADRGSSVVGTMVSAVRDMNGRLNEAAVETGGGDVDYKFACQNGGLVYWDVHLPTASTADSFSTITTDLRNLGFTGTTHKHLVFYDDPVGTNLCGQGTVHSDSSLSPNNANNAGPDFAIVYDAFGGCTGSQPPMHELGHNLGAVQLDAPHTSSNWHCNDGWDVMCYADGGSTQCTTGGTWCVNTCTDIQHFDCGHDTYFHTNPAVGSYLATHWNLGSTLDNFLNFGTATCAATGIVVVYKDANFLGGCKAFNADDSDLSNDILSDGSGGNDVISSLKIASGYRATVYTDANYGGAIGTFTGVVSFVGASLNDAISSIHIDPCDPNASTVVYQDASYAGGCKSFSADAADLTQVRFSNNVVMNDQPSSIRVKSGQIVSLFADINFGGDSIDLKADSAQLPAGWNDRASSLKVAPVNSACDTAVLVLYEQPGQRGACRAFHFNEPHLNDNLFNDGTSVDKRASSWKIHTGYIVQFFPGDGFTGTGSGGFFEDGDMGAMDNTVSSFKITCTAVEFESGVAVPRTACDETPDLV